MFLDFYGLREQPFGMTPDPAYLYATRQGLYLLYLKPSGVVIVRAGSGEVIAEVPVTAAVSALSMSQDGTMLGVAQRGSLQLWRLSQQGDRCS